MSDRLSFLFMQGPETLFQVKACMNGGENQQFVNFNRMIMVYAKKLFYAKKNLFPPSERFRSPHLCLT